MDRENIINLSFTVYKVTELFPKEEPLRTEIRKRVNNVLNDLLIFQNSQEIGIATNQLEKEIIENIEELKKYFESAIVKELASPTNFLVLQKEYDKIYRELKKEEKEESLKAESQRAEEHRSIKKWVLERQNRILDIVSKKQKIQVKEIQKNLPGISKRTIQRDLVFLTKKGLVRPEGDFSRTFYKLA